MSQETVLDYVTPLPPQRRSWRKVWITLAVVFLCSTCFVASVLPSMCASSERANRVKCQSNLSQIGKGIILYHNDHNRYPATLGDLVLSEMSPQVMICPSSNDDAAADATPQAMAKTINSTKGHCSYVYVGANLNPKSPADAVLVYERFDNHDKQGISVLYNDGSSDWLAKKQGEHLISELEAGHNPPRPMP